MEKIIIFGTGDLAKQLFYYLNNDIRYEVAFFCVTKYYYKESEYFGKKVIVLEELNRQYLKEYKWINGVGYKQLRNRKNIFMKLKNAGYELLNYIHPSVDIDGEIIGEGNIILRNAIIEPFCKVYNNNIIWSNVLVCHDCVIGSHNFIAGGSVIGGYSKVNSNNFIGFNAVVKEHININEEVLVGANSLILKSPKDYHVYYGNPAKKIRKHMREGICIE